VINADSNDFLVHRATRIDPLPDDVLERIYSQLDFPELTKKIIKAQSFDSDCKGWEGS